MEHPGFFVANNLIQNVTVSNNQISDSTEGGRGIWIAGGWHSAWASAGETTPGQVVNNHIENITLLANVVLRMNEGLTLHGGDGLGTTSNTVTGVGMVNVIRDSFFHDRLISANENGASNNTLAWEWKYGPYAIFLPAAIR